VDNPLGTPTSGEGGGGAAAEPGAGASPDGGQPEAGSDADGRGTPTEGSDADGRAIPAKWREAFKSDPELKALFFERRAFQREFPGGIQEVRGLKQTLESVGGESGLTEMQGNLADFRTLANQFLDGDPAYIQDVFETDPVAAVSHLPAYLDQAMKADEPSYNRIIAQKISGEHEAWGLRSTLKAAYDAIATDPAKAKQLLNKIASWSDRLKDVGEQPEDPRVKKLQDQIKAGRKEGETAQITQLKQSYESSAQTEIKKVTERILDSYLKGRKLPTADREMILEQIGMRTNKKVADDKDWTKQRDAAFVRARQTGNASASVKLAVARWEKELAIQVPQVVRLFGLGSGKVEPPEPGGEPPKPQGADASGFVKVAALPDPKTVDWSRTTNDMISKQHRCFVKGQKQGVYWVL
jgi:hypothetical protein